MSQRVSRPMILLNWIDIDRTSFMPMYRQVGDQIRGAIIRGALAPGAYIPASRALARDLGVSRVTTLQAYDQLIAEGFLEGKQGSGTRIARSLAEKPTATGTKAQRIFSTLPAHSEVHAQELYEGKPPGVAFQPGIPAFDAFPRHRWARLLRRHATRADQFILDYSHIGGYAPLRQTLAKYLNGSRGVACEPEQVIIVTSTRTAIDAVARLLWAPGSAVAAEDPGYLVAKRVLTAAGYRLRLVPVDEHGIDPDGISRRPERCVGAYLTPAHQWPMGVTLSARRRIELLNWAERAGAWILEDDIRFDSPPIATLHSLDRRRVIYIGTFSKTLVPSIRTAYLVVPPDLVGRFERAVYEHGVEPALHVQAALSDLIEEGHFVRHVARMRKLYARRRALLAGALEDAFGGSLGVRCPSGGLQLIADLPPGVSASGLARRAARIHLVARPMSAYQVEGQAKEALHLGFAAVPDADIAPLVERLHSAVADCF